MDYMDLVFYSPGEGGGAGGSGGDGAAAPAAEAPTIVLQTTSVTSVQFSTKCSV